jgi:excisionase family DNA binding protein
MKSSKIESSSAGMSLPASDGNLANVPLFVKNGAAQGAAVPERMLTKSDVASFFQIEIRTLENWMASGKVSYYRIGRTVRFRFSDLLRDLQSRCVR